MQIKINSRDVEPIVKHNGNIVRKRVFIGDLALTLTEIDPGVEVAPHSHDPIQIAYVLNGEAEVIVGTGESQRRVRVGPGDFFGFHSQLLHGVRVLGNSKFVLIDSYAPVGEDQRKDAYQLCSS